MKVFTFTEARQNFASVLDFAQKEGSVRITRRDGRAFVIQPLETPASPLAIDGVDLNIRTYAKETLNPSWDFTSEGKTNCAVYN
jgi:prevent-host-death family protein